MELHYLGERGSTESSRRSSVASRQDSPLKKWLKKGRACPGDSGHEVADIGISEGVRKSVAVRLKGASSM